MFKMLLRGGAVRERRRGQLLTKFLATWCLLGVTTNHTEAMVAKEYESLIGLPLEGGTEDFNF
jgi:hypothetical protein